LRLADITPLRLLHAACAGVALALVVLMLGWPLLAATPFGDALSPCFSETCHQNPERSLHVAGIQMPVCSRCFGIALGLGAAALLLALHPAIVRSAPHSFAIIAAAMIMLMIIDGILGVAAVIPDSWNLWRIATGALGGLGLYFLPTAMIGCLPSVRVGRAAVGAPVPDRKDRVQRIAGGRSLA
jgi:uncharacterized membrane protein